MVTRSSNSRSWTSLRSLTVMLTVAVLLTAVVISQWNPSDPASKADETDEPSDCVTAMLVAEKAYDFDAAVADN